MEGQLRIDEMFAFVLVDDDGSEGIPAVMGPGGLFPLVGADMARVESLRPEAQRMAERSGKPIELVRFTTRESLDTITPEGPPPERREPTIDDLLAAAKRGAVKWAERRDPDAQFRAFDEPQVAAAPADMEHASGVLVGTPVAAPVPMVSITMLHGEDSAPGKSYLLTVGTAEDLRDLLRDAIKLARAAAQ